MTKIMTLAEFQKAQGEKNIKSKAANKKALKELQSNAKERHESEAEFRENQVSKAQQEIKKLTNEVVEANKKLETVEELEGRIDDLTEENKELHEADAEHVRTYNQVVETLDKTNDEYSSYMVSHRKLEEDNSLLVKSNEDLSKRMEESVILVQSVQKQIEDLKKATKK